jgi:SAM-dependent methyltransferase
VPFAEPCPICRCEESTVALPKPRDFEYETRPDPRFHYRRCAACGSEFLAPRPSRVDVAAFYPSDYRAYHDDGRSIVARGLARVRALSLARRYRRQRGGRPGRLFDVGPGACRHFDVFQRVGRLECAGVEIHPELAAQARSRGYDVRTGALEELDAGSWRGSFDFVTMNHVLEHLLDPVTGLRRAFELLRPGGIALGQLPNVDSWEKAIFRSAWAGYHFPRHLQAFSRAALAGSLQRTGFERIVVAPAPHLQTAVSIQNWLVGRGLPLRLRFGKCRLHGALLLAVAPFELAAMWGGRSGVIRFEARRPASAGAV